MSKSLTSKQIDELIIATAKKRAEIDNRLCEYKLRFNTAKNKKSDNEVIQPTLLILLHFHAISQRH